MGDLSFHLKMRSGDFFHEASWKSDRIFTGLVPSYPVELFIALIEHEALQLNHQESKMCRDAWCLVSSDRSLPSGAWKASVTDKYEELNDKKWDDMKEDLLNAFGRQEPFNIEAKMQLIQSLTKADNETFKTFLFRIQWVMMKIVGNEAEHFWTQAFFLLGLQEPDQKYVLEKLKGREVDDIAGIVDTLDDPEYVKQFKMEPCDIGLADLENLKHEINVGMDRDDYEPFDDPMTGWVVKEEAGESDDIKPLKIKRKHKRGAIVSQQCQECGEQFKGKVSLANHMKHRHGESLKCNACNVMVQNTPEEWDSHETENHLGQCLVCLAQFDGLTLEQVRAHHTLEHCGKQMRCEKCLKEMGYQDYQHSCIKLPLPGKGVPVGKMRQSMKERAGFRVHRIKEDEDPMKVKVMTSHLTLGTGSKAKWFCGFCRDQFPSQKELTQHTLQAHDGFKYQCDICTEYRAKDIGKVAQHKLQKHGVITETYKEYACQVPDCNFKTIKESNFDFHMRMQHSEETATATTCNVCGKRKGTPSALRRHVESAHMQLKPFSCEICKAGFAQKSGLAMHMKNLHPSDNQKVICNICGAELKHEASLKDHIMRKHNSEDPAANTCPECGKMFSVKYDLRDHMKRAHMVHTHLPCPKCDKRFPKMQNLRCHILSTHLKVTIKPFACFTCGNSYVRSKDCWQHVALKHESWPNERALKDWRILARTKPNLVDKRDCRKEEEEALKGHLPPTLQHTSLTQDEFLKIEYPGAYSAVVV